MSNKERFMKKKRNVKTAWTISFLFFLAITIWFICLYAIKDDGMYLLFVVFVGIADIFCLVFLFCTLAGVKFHTYKYKNHEISLYLGWTCDYLILDDEIVDKHTGSWRGANPIECELNGEKVILKVGAFTLNNYTLCAGNKVLH